MAFLAVFFLLYGGLNAYVFVVLKTAFAIPHPAARALGLALLLLVFAPLLTRKLERAGWERLAKVSAWAGFSWMGLAFMGASVSLLVHLAWWISTLLSHPAGMAQSPRTLDLFSVTLSGLIGLYAFYERSAVRIERVHLTTEKDLGPTGRLGIAQISDVHIGLMNGIARIRKVVQTLEQCEPDVIVSTGDLMDSNLASQLGLARDFRKLKPPLGAYAIVGNHECYAGLGPSLEFMQSAGFEVLRDRETLVRGIRIVGVDDPAVHADVEQVEASLLPAPTSQFTLLLKHRPEVRPQRPAPFDLQLSGHTHKGQIFPFSLLTRLHYRAHAGLFRLGSAYLYVSRGTGAWGPPFRLFARPEITLIEITHAAETYESPVARLLPVTE